MVNAKKLELIEELKALRVEKGITYQEIAEKTKENGEPVSISTIKLVFSDKHNHNHDYKNVLKPISDVLTPPSDDDTLELKVLQTRLELKEQIIEQYQSRLDSRDKKHKDRETYYIEQINYFKEQTLNRDEHIKNRDEHIKNLDSTIAHLNEAVDRKDALIRQLLLKENIIDPQ